MLLAGGWGAASCAGSLWGSNCVIWDMSAVQGRLGCLQPGGEVCAFSHLPVAARCYGRARSPLGCSGLECGGCC